MVDRPAVVSPGPFSDALLARDQNPAQRVVGPHLLAVEQFGIVRNQLLKLVFTVERLFLERLEPCLAPSVNPLGHSSIPAWALNAF